MNNSLEIKYYEAELPNARFVGTPEVVQIVPEPEFMLETPQPLKRTAYVYDEYDLDIDDSDDEVVVEVPPTRRSRRRRQSS